MSRSKNKLMTPGPVPVSSEVLKELARPILHHRTNEFSDILERVFKDLKPLFGTQEDCFILNSSGTGAMEAALVNSIKRGDEILVIDSGKFGHRWHQMATSLGYKSHKLSFPWGKNIDLTLVEQTLKQNPHIKAVLSEASETSTGALLPIKELSALTHNTDTLMIVDGITAVGCMNLPMDDWGIDILISGSQKAFMLPTGLSFLAASKKAWTSIEKIAPTQSYYWNLVNEQKALRKKQTHFSSAVSLICALDVVLTHFNNIGINTLYKQTVSRANHFRGEACKNGIQLFAQTPSPSLSCLLLPENIDGNLLKTKLEEESRIVVAGGQDQLKGRVLRVGHMGHMSLKDLSETAGAIHTQIESLHV